jgi:hypothetical protein
MGIAYPWGFYAFALAALIAVAALSMLPRSPATAEDPARESEMEGGRLAQQ